MIPVLLLANLALDSELLKDRRDRLTRTRAVRVYDPVVGFHQIFNHLTVVDTGIGDFVILDQFSGLVRLHLILLPLEFQLQVQHYRPCWAKVLPCSQDPIDT